MIPAPFGYAAARSAAHAAELLAEHGDDAKLLAGGHSLLPMMKLRLATPAMLIDIGGAAGLAGIEEDNGEVVIGAAVTHAAVAGSAMIRRAAPVVAYAASRVGDPQVRHRGTIGGSLAHADPAADLPMAVLAADGSVDILGPDGSRRVLAADLFTGFFETCLRPAEVITAVRLPARPGEAWGYQKFVRRGIDWAIVGVAAAGDRIALANMGPVPFRAAAAERALAAGASAAEAADLAADGTTPGDDIQASPEYRRHLARVLTRRALAGERG